MPGPGTVVHTGHGDTATTIGAETPHLHDPVHATIATRDRTSSLERPGFDVNLAG